MITYYSKREIKLKAEKKKLVIWAGKDRGSKDL